MGEPQSSIVTREQHRKLTRVAGHGSLSTYRQKSWLICAFPLISLKSKQISSVRVSISEFFCRQVRSQRRRIFRGSRNLSIFKWVWWRSHFPVSTKYGVGVDFGVNSPSGIFRQIKRLALTERAKVLCGDRFGILLDYLTARMNRVGGSYLAVFRH